MTLKHDPIAVAPEPYGVQASELWRRAHLTQADKLLELADDLAEVVRTQQPSSVAEAYNMRNLIELARVHSMQADTYPPDDPPVRETTVEFDGGDALSSIIRNESYHLPSESRTGPAGIMSTFTLTELDRELIASDVENAARSHHRLSRHTLPWGNCGDAGCAARRDIVRMLGTR